MAVAATLLFPTVPENAGPALGQALPCVASNLHVCSLAMATCRRHGGDPNSKGALVNQPSPRDPDRDALNALRLIGPDPENWVPEVAGIDHDVAIIGGGQSGRAFAVRSAPGPVSPG